MDKVLVGVSGGVDSAVSAYLLKKAGYDVLGCYMNLIDKENNPAEDAISVCEGMGISFIQVDLYNEFKSKIKDYFAQSYKDCLTPNPCIECNKFFKFGIMYDIALSNGAKYIATGHYARKEFSPKYNRYVIKMSRNEAKDQSYFLYGINKDIIPYILFPLEDIDSKEDVRNIASLNGISVARKKDSLDVCFIPNKDYKSFLINNNYVKPNIGDIVHTSGNVLGKHEGLFNYTIGQRKGLGVSYSHPLYVVGFDVSNNKLIVGEEELLYKNEIVIYDTNLLLFDDFTDGLEVLVKIRYQAKREVGYLYHDNDNIKIKFKNKVKSPTSGQSAVFYIDDILAGGGKIK